MLLHVSQSPSLVGTISLLYGHMAAAGGVGAAVDRYYLETLKPRAPTIVACWVDLFAFRSMGIKCLG